MKPRPSQRNGESARGHHVGCRAAADGAKQRTGEHGNLSGTAGIPASQANGNVLDQTSQTALFQKHAKNNKQNNIVGRGPQAGAKDPLRNHVDVIHQPGNRTAADAEYTGHQIAEISIEQEDNRDNTQFLSHTPPGRFQDQHREQDGHDDICLVGDAGTLQKAPVLCPTAISLKGTT